MNSSDMCQDTIYCVGILETNISMIGICKLTLVTPIPKCSYSICNIYLALLPYFYKISKTIEVFVMTMIKGNLFYFVLFILNNCSNSISVFYLKFVFLLLL